jgi:hypothetical protein
MAETAIVLALVGLLSLLVERTMTSTRDADLLLHATRSALERGQRLAFDLREMIVGSRRIFQDDDVGRGYLDALDLSRDPRRPGSRLPRFDEAGPLGPDAVGTPATGNVLLFVREGEAVAAVADAATRKIQRIDTYRFVCAYPSQTARRLVFGGPPAVDLVVWRSVAFPSRAQILAIADATERRNVVADLVSRFGHTHAWDAGASADAAFYALDALGTIDAVPFADPMVAEDAAVSDRGRLVAAGLQLAATRTDAFATRPVFTVEGTWAPDGFELKVAGPSGSRKVWFHLVVEGPAGRGSVAQPHTMIASARDL